MGEYWNTLEKKQQRVILLAALAVSLIFFAVLLQDLRAEDLPVTVLARPAGANSEPVAFTVTAEAEDGENYEWDYEGTLELRALTGEEAREEVKRTLSVCEENMFFAGESAEAVVTGIKVPARPEGCRAEISWEAVPSVFDTDGAVSEGMIREETPVTLYIKGVCGDAVEERAVSLTVRPPAVTEEERLKRGVNAMLDLATAREDDPDETVILPETFESYELSFKKETEQQAGKVVLLGLAVVLLLMVKFHTDNEDRIRKRREELDACYADFCVRLTILIGCGMTLRASWERIAGDGSAGGALGEEVRMTVKQLENGVTEREAYENFGRRIGTFSYLRLSGILTGSLRMGSGQILKRLETEADQAMKERRAQAKILGERAGTRILLPMMVQLLLIFMIILVPAMLNM